MKKVFSLILALTLVLALAACGSSGNNGGAGSNGQDSSQTAGGDASGSDAVDVGSLVVESGKLHMSTNASFPPYEMVANDGSFEGIDVEIATLIAEKMGPHFAVGDTCYSWSEDVRVYNPNGKEVIAKDNSVSILRKEDVSKAYYQCHTDITIPYEELARIAVITREGKEIVLLSEGRFVLPGTEILNEPLKNQDK